MSAYIPSAQPRERFLTVYVFCPKPQKDDTVRYMAHSSVWHSFVLDHVDAGQKVSVVVFATTYDTEIGRLRNSPKSLSQSIRECTSLFTNGFDKEVEKITSQLYPSLFDKLRKAGFIGRAVLVQHHDHERTLYQLEHRSVRILAEQKVA